MSFGHFIPLGILSYLDKMSFGHFIHGHFVIRGHFVTLGISSYNRAKLVGAGGAGAPPVLLVSRSRGLKVSKSRKDYVMTKYRDMFFIIPALIFILIY